MTVLTGFEKRRSGKEVIMANNINLQPSYKFKGYSHSVEPMSAINCTKKKEHFWNGKPYQRRTSKQQFQKQMDEKWINNLNQQMRTPVHPPPVSHSRMAVKLDKTLHHPMDQQLLCQRIQSISQQCSKESNPLNSISVRQQQLFTSGKLTLLLDLDQTLVDTVSLSEVPGDPSRHRDSFVRGYGPQNVRYLTKVRPGTRELLENLSHCYHLVICTFGETDYARAVVNYLDPQHQWLDPLDILTRDNCPDMRISKYPILQSMFRNGSSVVMLDDREDVWNGARNLVRLEPYRYFHVALQDPSYRDDDQILPHMVEVLLKIHSRFYSHIDFDSKVPTTEKVVAQVRSEILQGTKLFLDPILETSLRNREVAKIKYIAEKLGADVLTESELNDATHLVTIKESINGRNSTSLLVSSEWLRFCSLRWMKVPEEQFAVVPVWRKPCKTVDGARRTSIDGNPK